MMNNDSMIPAIKNYLVSLQKTVCLALAHEDGQGTFITDAWSRAEGGGGTTCVLEHALVIEKGSVNFSHIVGVTLPPSASQRHPQLAGFPFQATGLSLVIHPRNPYVPTVHMNLRFFCLEKATIHAPLWWFGGGFDLTPYYPFLEDCQHWHQTAQAACFAFGPDLYAQYKKNCDDYFYLKHRREARGIGGIFFDDLNQWDFQTCFKFIQSIGNHFLKAYLPIMQKRKNHPYGDRERQFQAYRRSRYVEFNLIYDRGTLFGLQSGGRIESILTSMPPQAAWHYNWQPEADSREAALVEEFLVARDWLS